MIQLSRPVSRNSTARIHAANGGKQSHTRKFMSNVQSMKETEPSPMENHKENVVQLVRGFPFLGTLGIATTKEQENVEKYSAITRCF